VLSSDYLRRDVFNMAEQAQTGGEPVEAATPVETPPAASHEGEGEGGFVPRGAFYFAVALIIGYAIYFFLTYFEVVILRGGA
jgi:hypothetical protein